MPWLPLPDQPWYGYIVRPIAPSLRVQDYPRGLTSDMAIPIAPNTSHPNSRAPIQPDTRPFPFSNCYFWFRYELLLRVIPRPVERFDHSNAVELGARKTNELATQFNEDYIRSEETLRDRTQQAPSKPQTDTDTCLGSDREIECWNASCPVHAKNRDIELWPLVDLWLDLTAHLSEDTIPNPEGLFEEVDNIRE